MIYIVRAVASSTAIEMPAVVHLANTKHFAMCAPIGLGIGNLLAGVFRDLMSLLKRDGGEAASAMNSRRLYC
jgi:hypothetical protein